MHGYFFALIILAGTCQVATATSCPQNGKCPDELAAPALAAAEFFVTFCQRVDPGHAAAYRIVQQKIAMDEDPAYLDRLRKSEHYQEGLKLAESGIRQMGPDKAFATCGQMLSERQQQSRSGKGTTKSTRRRAADGAQ